MQVSRYNIFSYQATYLPISRVVCRYLVKIINRYTYLSMVYLLRKLTQHILKILNKSQSNLRKRTAITRQSHSGETTILYATKSSAILFRYVNRARVPLPSPVEGELQGRPVLAERITVDIRLYHYCNRVRIGAIIIRSQQYTGCLCSRNGRFIH